MKLGVKHFVLMISSLLFVSCFEANTEALEKEISKVQDTQKIILQKIEALEKGQQSMKRNLASAGNDKKKNNNKPKADPNKVYNVSVGNSFVKGNKKAPVTITYWTDFQ
jgi:protein-disulfide isomerase